MRPLITQRNRSLRLGRATELTLRLLSWPKLLPKKERSQTNGMPIRRGQMTSMRHGPKRRLRSSKRGGVRLTQMKESAKPSLTPILCYKRRFQLRPKREMQSLLKEKIKLRLISHCQHWKKKQVKRIGLLKQKKKKWKKLKVGKATSQMLKKRHGTQSLRNLNLLLQMQQLEEKQLQMQRERPIKILKV